MEDFMSVDVLIFLVGVTVGCAVMNAIWMWGKNDG